MLTGYVQQAHNGDVAGAATAIDAANNVGCSVDAFGSVIYTLSILFTSSF